MAVNARNLALAEQHLPGQDMVSGCPACWLASRELAERLNAHSGLMAETNEALKEVGLNLKGTVKPRHMVEVLVEDIGFTAMKQAVVKPLQGLKIAGYVGCQTNRPFGIAGESFENPQYLDKMIEPWVQSPLPATTRKSPAAVAHSLSPNPKSRIDRYAASSNRLSTTARR